MAVTQKNPFATLRCAHPACDEVIYRDTLDKDDAWVTDYVPGKYFCSEVHAVQAESIPVYRAMAQNGHRLAHVKQACRDWVLS